MYQFVLSASIHKKIVDKYNVPDCCSEVNNLMLNHLQPIDYK